jgi:hypothetical protein
VEITWRRRHSGQSWQGWNEGGFIVGEVVGYGDNVGVDPQPHRHWGGVRQTERLPGQYATLNEVKAAVEAALTAAF